MLKLKRSFATFSQDERPDISLDLSYSQTAAPSCHQAANFTPIHFEPVHDMDDMSTLHPAKKQRFFVREEKPEEPLAQPQQQLPQKHEELLPLRKAQESRFRAPDESGLGKAVDVIDAYKKHKYKKNKDQKVLFTEEDVNSILEFREQQLRVHYDLILQERLQEQFSYFSQFNQDYIHRTFKSSDFSYAS